MARIVPRSAQVPCPLGTFCAKRRCFAPFRAHFFFDLAGVGLCGADGGGPSHPAAGFGGGSAQSNYLPWNERFNGFTGGEAPLTRLLSGRQVHPSARERYVSLVSRALADLEAASDPLVPGARTVQAPGFIVSIPLVSPAFLFREHSVLSRLPLCCDGPPCEAWAERGQSFVSPQPSVTPGIVILCHLVPNSIQTLMKFNLEPLH